MNKVVKATRRGQPPCRKMRFQITLGAVGKFFAGTHPKSERCSTAMRFWLHCSHLLLQRSPGASLAEAN